MIEVIDEDGTPVDEIIVEEVDEDDFNKRPPPLNPSFEGKVDQHQLAIFDTAGAQSVADHFQEKIRGKRRSLAEDDSQTAFGDQFAERFGHIGSMPLPSAPPWPEEENEEQLQEIQKWVLSRPIERKKFRYHEFFEEFFQCGGVDDNRPYTTCSFSTDQLPVDAASARFREKMKEMVESKQMLRSRSSADAQKSGIEEATEDIVEEKDTLTSAVETILGDNHRNINHAQRFPIYLPESLTEYYANDRRRAERALCKNSLYDEVQYYLQQSRGKEASAWNPMATQISSGTLDFRINAQATRLVILGEGYSMANITGGKEAWKNAGSKISKDTDLYQDPDNRFEIVRIKPGELGLVHRPVGVHHPFMRLMPGRYVLLKKFVRLIGIAQLQTNKNVGFQHPDCRESDVLAFGQRFSAYQLHAGNGVFVDDRKGTFFLHAPPDRDVIYVFDYAALEKPNNKIVNPRDLMVASNDRGYHIVRLVDGQRILLRIPTGEDIVLTYEPDHPELNVLHLPSNIFGFNGKVYDRSDQIARAETVSSICLSENDVLVLRDDNGAVRFLKQFNARDFITLRQPWIAVEIINRMEKEYIFESNGLRVASLKPTSNQWPLLYDEASGEVKMLPPSLEYMISTANGQSYIGMADRNRKDTQRFDVPGVGEVIITVVESGQIGMARINNYSFFLSPSTDPYVIRPPNEFLGLVDKDEVITRIPNSDLHRVNIPSSEWAVAMIDGRQVVLDPSKAAYHDSVTSQFSMSTSSGSGIWIFRAQQFDLQGPRPVNEKLTQLFNVQRIQVPMDEVGYGYDDGMLVVWPPGNHTININSNKRFENFFRTKLDDIKIEDFDVVWKNGVKGKIDVSVAFHIDGITETALVHESDYEKIKQAIALCGHDSVLRNRIIENVQHHLLAAIAEMDPLGYGYAYSLQSDLNFLQSTGAPAGIASGDGNAGKQKTLLDLENLFSSQVQQTLSSYGVKVDNVTITKNDPDEHFVAQSELMLKQLMEAHKDKQVAELVKDKEGIQQKQELQKMQAETARKKEEAAQAQIEREIQAQNVAVEARAKAQAEAEQQKVQKAAELAQQEMEAESRVKQQRQKIIEEQEKQKAKEVEMQTRQTVARHEAETASIEASAKALAEAQARLKVAELTMQAAKLDAETEELRARGIRVRGEAEMRIRELDHYGSLTPEQIERIKIAELQLTSTSTLAQSLLQSGVPAAGITQLALAPEVVRSLGAAEGVRSVLQSGTSEYSIQTFLAKET